MDKDFVQLNEEQLENVAGGTADLFGSETCAFLLKKTPEEALAYLKEKGIINRRLGYYMNIWHENHN